MNTDQIVDSKVTTMTDLGGNKSKVLLLKDESEIEAFKEELRLCIVVGQSEQLVCNHPNERWKFDESGVDMYCEECAKNE